MLKADKAVDPIKRKEAPYWTSTRYVTGIVIHTRLTGRPYASEQASLTAKAQSRPCDAGPIWQEKPLMFFGRRPQRGPRPRFCQQPEASLLARPETAEKPHPVADRMDEIQ
jgi:hypothetical protein